MLSFCFENCSCKNVNMLSNFHSDPSSSNVCVFSSRCNRLFLKPNATISQKFFIILIEAAAESCLSWPSSSVLSRFPNLKEVC